MRKCEDVTKVTNELVYKSHRAEAITISEYDDNFGDAMQFDLALVPGRLVSGNYCVSLLLRTPVCLQTLVHCPRSKAQSATVLAIQRARAYIAVLAGSIRTAVAKQLLILLSLQVDEDFFLAPSLPDPCASGMLLAGPDRPGARAGAVFEELEQHVLDA